jgi:hypothetical protein
MMFIPSFIIIFETGSKRASGCGNLMAREVENICELSHFAFNVRRMLPVVIRHRNIKGGHNARNVKNCFCYYE